MAKRTSSTEIRKTELRSEDQMLLIFEAAREHEHLPLPQNIAHALVYLTKEERLLPFLRYGFQRYFGPYDRNLQMDMDAAHDIGRLDRKTMSFSPMQYTYMITDKGTDFALEVRGKINNFDKVKEFVDKKMKVDHDVLLDEAYACLSKQVGEEIGIDT